MSTYPSRIFVGEAHGDQRNSGDQVAQVKEHHAPKYLSIMVTLSDFSENWNNFSPMWETNNPEKIPYDL